MLRLPVAHYKPLEVELPFEEIIEYITILATIAVVDLVIRAHD